MLLLTVISYEALLTLLVAGCALSFPFFITLMKSHDAVGGKAIHTLRACLVYYLPGVSTLLSLIPVFGRYVDKFRCLYGWDNLIQDHYDEAHGEPFAVDTSYARITFITNKKFLTEVDQASDDVLSLQAAAKLVLQPERSMHNFNWPEKRGSDGTPQVETLRNLLKRNLPFVLAKSRVANLAILDKTFGSDGGEKGLNDMIRAATACTNALAIFGDELANNTKFVDTAIRFTKDVIIIAEVVRLLPSCLGPRIAKFLETRFNAQDHMFDMIMSMVQQRLKEQELSRLGEEVPEHKDCVQWLTERSSLIKPGSAKVTKPWSAERISHELMAIWFGAHYAMSVSTIFAAQDLALHPEYIEPLREELGGPAYQAFEETGSGLPLLDSFIKESMRSLPVDSISTRRKVLQTFEFSNGLRIEPGEWIAAPTKSMHHDPRNWIQPHEFHGFRHVQSEVLASIEHASQFYSPQPHKAGPLTDVRWVESWQTWGTGHIACPGRFHAAAAMKQILGLILSRYDLQLKTKPASRSLNYRSCPLPNLYMSVTLSQRQGHENVL